MGGTWWWYVLVGILIGWTTSTLTEWLWFRKRFQRGYDEGRPQRDDPRAGGAQSNRPQSNRPHSGNRASDAPILGTNSRAVPETETPKKPIDVREELAQQLKQLADESSEDESGQQAPSQPLNASHQPVDLPSAKTEGKAFGVQTSLPDDSFFDDSGFDVDAAVDIDMDVDAATNPATPNAMQNPLAATDSWRDISGQFYQPYRGNLSKSDVPDAGGVDAVGGESDKFESDESKTTPSPAKRASTTDIQRPDALSAIRGIGPAYERRLYETGIFTWHQLAVSDPETLRKATQALPSSDPARWIEQAAELARTKNRQNAVYQGDPPDDMGKIDGIGTAYAQTLFEQGIFTYRRLANATPAALVEILEPKVDESTCQAWIKQAQALLEERS